MLQYLRLTPGSNKNQDFSKVKKNKRSHGELSLPSGSKPVSQRNSSTKDNILRKSSPNSQSKVIQTRTEQSPTQEKRQSPFMNKTRSKSAVKKEKTVDFLPQNIEDAHI